MDAGRGAQGNKDSTDDRSRGTATAKLLSCFLVVTA